MGKRFQLFTAVYRGIKLCLVQKWLEGSILKQIYIKRIIYYFLNLKYIAKKIRYPKCEKIFGFLLSRIFDSETERTYLLNYQQF